MTIQYKTGRDYGTAQVLEIEVTGCKQDAEYDSFFYIQATFKDIARNISGKIDNAIAFGTKPYQIGESVLAAYDSGRYTEL